ncbi:hypothetical protein N0V93_001140 [Gnomoniopsis smithogilvyi]|uniref:Uncharacterized protein n=1 Tax=Gnomoniopsis smithogilvyi TaxID=1191159 RepID=A0A9W9D1D7_9PEZI|nr:hypothetical protein N0V93_001140 [Gnomoniopsis smithogilvyi]
MLSESNAISVLKIQLIQILVKIEVQTLKCSCDEDFHAARRQSGDPTYQDYYIVVRPRKLAQHAEGDPQSVAKFGDDDGVVDEYEASYHENGDGDPLVC